MDHLVPDINAGCFLLCELTFIRNAQSWEFCNDFSIFLAGLVVRFWTGLVLPSMSQIDHLLRLQRKKIRLVNKSFDIDQSSITTDRDPVRVHRSWGMGGKSLTGAKHKRINRCLWCWRYAEIRKKRQIVEPVLGLCWRQRAVCTSESLRKVKERVHLKTMNLRCHMKQVNLQTIIPYVKMSNFTWKSNKISNLTYQTFRQDIVDRRGYFGSCTAVLLSCLISRPDTGNLSATKKKNRAEIGQNSCSLVRASLSLLLHWSVEATVSLWWLCDCDDGLMFHHLPSPSRCSWASLRPLPI